MSNQINYESEVKKVYPDSYSYLHQQNPSERVIVGIRLTKEKYSEGF